MSSASSLLPTLPVRTTGMCVRWAISLSFVSLAFACKRSLSPVNETALVPKATLQDQAWPNDPELTGVSGVSVRTQREIWIAPERTGNLVRVTNDNDTWGKFTPFPIVGLPSVPQTEGRKYPPDVESLAFLNKQQVLLGTEARSIRDQDPIYIARIRDKDVVVEDQLMFDYKTFKTQARINQGIEGLCVVENTVVAASEMVDTRHGQREALIGVISLDTREFYPHRVLLRSTTGKLSAISCRSDNERIVVHGIERHFGVIRLVRFSLPKRGLGETVPAVLVHDLAAHFNGESHNFEGLSWVSKDTLLSVTDNFYGRRTGSTLAYLIHLPTPQVITQ
ncbi:MAG: esterase-like activity of phytase family protein [Myxococcales bacterium]|nr:esterase-like activity of phytase family protein [Myxococcales bacterium]